MGSAASIKAAAALEAAHEDELQNALISLLPRHQQKLIDALEEMAARALAAYLIPGCVGRGVRLGSESSSGGAGGGDSAPAPAVSAKLGTWKSGNLGIWRYGDLEIQKFGDLGTWESRNLGSKKWKK